MQNKIFWILILTLCVNSLLALWGNLFFLRIPLWLFAPFVISIFYSRRKLPQQLLGEIGIMNYSILAFYAALIYFVHLKFGSVIHYESVDSAGHFDMCRTFSNNFELLFYRQSDLMAYKTYPISYYVNCGLVLSLLGTGDFWSDFRVFSLFNLFVYFLMSVSIYQLIDRIKLNVYLKYLIFVLIITGFYLDLLVEGFLSQQLGLLFFIAYINVAYLSIQSYRNSWTLPCIKVILASGIFLAYHYYIAEIILLELFILYYFDRSFIKLKEISIVGIASILMVAPSLRIYFDSSKIIGTNGSIYRDLILNGLLICPAFLNFVTIADSPDKKFVKALTSSILVFSLAMLLLAVKGISSSYYFFKNYPLIYICLAMNFLVFFSTTRVLCARWKLKLLIIFILVAFYGIYPYFKNALGAGNSIVQLRTYRFFMKDPQIDKESFQLLDALGKANKEKLSTCISTSDEKFLIWSTQITGGLFFRGEYQGNDAWSGHAWKLLAVDSTCEEKYDFILSFDCSKANREILYRNSKGCLYGTQGKKT